MKDIELKMMKYGRTLTDRADGKRAYKEILSMNEFPTILNFKDVISLGSSFGDETVAKIAIANGGTIKIVNANKAIQACLSNIEEDFNIKIEYI